MIGNNDIEIQADFDEIDDSLTVLRAIQLRQKRYKFKNPLETLKNYKDRVIRYRRIGNLLTESVSIPRPTRNFQISGTRCVSVDIRKTASMVDSKISSSKNLKIRPKVLPKIIRNSYVYK